MKKNMAIMIVGVVAIMACNLMAAGPEMPLKEHPAVSAYDGWRLGTQAWSFNRFTFYEGLDKTRSLGLDYIEAYPGQKLSKDGDGKFHHNMSEELRKEVKQKLKDAQIKVVNYGVVGLGNDEAKAREVFEFAKDMGIETIASEPPFEAFDMLDKLCQEYKINLAVHNHPKPSRYWNPDTVLKVAEGRSDYIGACADTGHWVRSGLDPVECLKKLEGRIKSLHFKEIKDGHDVPWGTGAKRAPKLLEELHRQGFEGVFSIEYEYNWSNSVPEMRQCVAFFEKKGRELNPTGWEPLFDEDFANADMKEGSWEWKQGVLTRMGGGDIWTKGKYSDFVLDMEYKLAPKTNSGVFIRTQDHNWLPWIEVQVEDSHGKEIDRHVAGGIFDVLAPSKNAVKPAGKWNRMTIGAKDNKVYVVLNNEPIIDMDLNDWDEAHKNPDGSKNKFNVAYKDLPREGFIGLQDHGQAVWYRNLSIKELQD
ncbi:Xylose isomerase-like TIM barrel [Anaerohalosphaera lusitana]|uniref:Xylose isomerase-like TIM barrel n=1 Tax=Anaerohalosphaera lusitana TaxID=1936003 RepID=A0A1U9NN63_9BACT|nr:family 16 glycoside hydrolase [Anaerohalosphaera lusitana]AQT69275.1 Xylose isomerase-like TIM barrel [Anaerohalosphaera lusitana]